MSNLDICSCTSCFACWSVYVLPHNNFPAMQFVWFPSAPVTDFQNGSILDGLALWKRNVDKRFEGVEECMICFYVLHGATCHLPKLTCRTCRKRFHSACLVSPFFLLSLPSLHMFRETKLPPNRLVYENGSDSES